jgi:hypothetical protein
MNKFTKLFVIKLKYNIFINIPIFKDGFIFILVLIILCVFEYNVFANNYISQADIFDNKTDTFNNKVVLINDNVYYYKNPSLNYKIIDNFLDLVKYDNNSFLFLNYEDNKFNLYLFSKNSTFFWNYFKHFSVKKIYSINQNGFLDYIGSFYKNRLIFLFFDKYIFVFEIDNKYNIKRIFKDRLINIIGNGFGFSNTDFKTTLLSILYSYDNKILIKAGNDYFICEVDFNNNIVLKLLKKISVKNKSNDFIINQLFVDKNNLTFYSFFEKIGDKIYYIVQDVYDNCYYKVSAVNSYESNYIVLNKLDNLLFIQNNYSVDLVYDKDELISIKDAGYYVFSYKLRDSLILVLLNNSSLFFGKLNQLNKEIEPLLSIKDVIYAFKNQNYVYFIKKEEDFYYYLYFVDLKILDYFMKNNKENEEFDFNKDFIRNTYLKLDLIPEKFFVFN